MTAPPAEALSGPARRLAASLLALGRIRLELLALELEEEKERIAALVFWSVLSALAAGFGLLLLLMLVTVALWDSHRLAALGAACALFLGLAVWGWMQMRRRSAQGPSLFRASIAELREDAAGLQRPPSP